MIISQNNCPDDWRICKVEEVLSVNIQTLPSSTAPDYSFNYISIEEVNTQQINYKSALKTTFAEAPGRARRVLNDGDLLFSTVRPNLKSFAVFRKLNDENWIASTGFAVAKAKEDNDALFFFYQLLSTIGERQFHSLVVGSNYPAINESDFRKLKVFRPPYYEQVAIASMLSKVDEAIEAIRCSIQAAERLKLALMQNLLTGKIKPDGSFRNGNEFEETKIGLLPKSWQVKLVNDVSIQVTDGEHTTPNRVESGYYLLSARNIKNGHLNLNDVDYLSEAELRRIQKRCNPQKGDILISCSGTIGNVCIVPEGLDAGMVRSVALVKLNKDMIEPEFIELVFQSYLLQRQMKVSVASSVQGNLFQGAIKKLRIPYPPTKEERFAIVSKANQIEHAIKYKQGKITTLERLKKSLMQNLLTGKKRVAVEQLIEVTSL